LIECLFIVFHIVIGVYRLVSESQALLVMVTHSPT